MYQIDWYLQIIYVITELENVRDQHKISFYIHDILEGVHAIATLVYVRTNSNPKSIWATKNVAELVTIH